MTQAPLTDEPHPAATDQAGPVYRAADWFAVLASFASSLAVYVYTLCPTVGFGDDGCLITASYRFGVPYPTGYPTWTMLMKLDRYDGALAVAVDFKRADPLNGRVDGMRDAIKSARDQDK